MEKHAVLLLVGCRYDLHSLRVFDPWCKLDLQLYDLCGRQS
jgi:hypothetical protein